MQDDELPDVRDGLTRTERIILRCLHEAQRELEVGDSDEVKSNGRAARRAVPTALLYGRVCEHIAISVPDFQRILQRLVGLRHGA